MFISLWGRRTVAHVNHDKLTQQFQAKMVERVKWSRERPCVYWWLLITIKVHTLFLHSASLNHVTTNVLTSKIPAVFHNRHMPQVQTLPANHTHEQTTFPSGSQPWYTTTMKQIRRTRSRATKIPTCGKRTDVHHAIKITNQKSVRVQNESRHLLS